MIRNTESETRAALAEAEANVVRATVHLRRIEGKRDELLRELVDLEGADSARFVGAR